MIIRASFMPPDRDRTWFAPALKDDARVPVGGKFVVTETRDAAEPSEATSADWQLLSAHLPPIAALAFPPTAA